MYDILTAIYCGELSGLKGKCPLEPPYSIAEERIRRLLQSMAPGTASEFRQEIRALVMEQADAAFQSGVRFGAQLTLQLLGDF